jgi:hypothetical protein
MFYSVTNIQKQHYRKNCSLYGEDLSQVTVATESIVITMHYLLTDRMIVLLYDGL